MSLYSIRLGGSSLELFELFDQSRQTLNHGLLFIEKLWRHGWENPFQVGVFPQRLCDACARFERASFFYFQVANQSGVVAYGHFGSNFCAP